MTNRTIHTGDYLGRMGTDRATGFHGVITTVCVEISGNIRLRLERRALGTETGEAWFDAERVKIDADIPAIDLPAAA